MTRVWEGGGEEGEEGHDEGFSEGGEARNRLWAQPRGDRCIRFSLKRITRLLRPKNSANFPFSDSTKFTHLGTFFFGVLRSARNCFTFGIKSILSCRAIAINRNFLSELGDIV